jgi:metallo-beta-lactamase family protein
VGTLGRQIYDGAKSVRLFNETVIINAQVRMLHAISGHADQQGLVTWISSFNPKPQRVFITHGEEEAALKFDRLLQENGFKTAVPFSGDSWNLPKDEQQKAGTRLLAEKKKRKQQKAATKDSTLNLALARLTALVQSSQGLSNKLKEKFARQINELAKRWED